MAGRDTSSRVATAKAAKAIGQTLKRWRTERGLTLREVAKAARGHPEPIAFDHLSRVENGALMPSVPKLSALARVYERPISDLVDVYESVARAGLAPKRASLVHLQELGIHALSAGKYAKALACFERALDAATTARIAGERLAIMYHAMGRALTKAGRFLTARQYLEEALRTVETMPTRAKLMRDLAFVHAEMGDTILAELLTRGAESLEGGGQHPRKREI